MKINTRKSLAIAVALAGIALPGVARQADAHPHDILAQCQLPDGKWVMCDQTIHDTLTGKHVNKPSAGRPGNLTTAPKRN